MDLADATKRVLADSFKLYLKAHNFHWNVEGPTFSSLHELFGNIYGDLYESVDVLAEEIRAMGSYAPGSFRRFDELSSIEDEVEIIEWQEMIRRLLRDIDTLQDSIKIAYQMAEDYGNHGLSNYLAERQDALKKHSWMLRSTIK